PDLAGLDLCRRVPDGQAPLRGRGDVRRAQGHRREFVPAHGSMERGSDRGPAYPADRTAARRAARRDARRRHKRPETARRPRRQGMRLCRLAEAAGMDAGDFGAAQVTGFAIDHRKVAPGTVFGAFQGTVANGEDFIDAAMAAGAIAVVARPEARVAGAAHFAHPQPRRAFARLAAQFFRPVPATVVAVTGTNGKSTRLNSS